MLPSYQSGGLYIQHIQEYDGSIFEFGAKNKQFVWKPKKKKKGDRPACATNSPQNGLNP